MTYNSDDDYGDAFLDGFQGTVATLPLSQPLQPARTNVTPRKSPSPARIEVQASSPHRFTSPMRTTPIPQGALNGGKLAHFMAPPGTFFRPPLSSSQIASQRGRSETVECNFSDEEIPKAIEVSSDEEEHTRGSSGLMKRTTFIRNETALNQPERVEESPAKNIFNKYRFSDRPPVVPQKRPTGVVAGTNGNARRPEKISRQTIPSKAIPVSEQTDLSLDDIQDFRVRKQVENLKNVFSPLPISVCMQAWTQSKENYSDAMSILSDYLDRMHDNGDGKTIDLTVSDDELQEPTNERNTVKRHVTNAKTIQEKWGATRSKHPDFIGASQSNSKAQSPEPLKKRRLIRPPPPSPGITHSSPARISRAVPEKPKSSKADIEGEIVIDVLSDRDSDGGRRDDVSHTRTGAESELLEFLNSCTASDLNEVASLPLENVERVLSRRPFADLEAVRAITIDSETTSRKGKSRLIKKEVGNRLVDVCLEVFETYSTVDHLVAKCEELGRPIREEMDRFGIEASKNGELDLTDFDHDSGIGTPNSSIDGDEGHSRKAKRLVQPRMMSHELIMKDYQVLGLNWLALLFSRQMSGILADDMGLGKTCQVIAFLTHLFESNKSKGPHLIIVPGSTLENWLREFSKFSPDLVVRPYYGSQKERAELQYDLLDGRDEVNVVVTTYDMSVSKSDAHFLRHLRPVVCVFDEGHALKNSKTTRYQQLMRIPAQFRLLLTGTPLQNNLQELISLLAFIMPSVFQDHGDDLALLFKHKAKTTDDSGRAALLSSERINRARSMMTPFILRRKKDQVLKHMPRKFCSVEACHMSENQMRVYKEEAAKATRALGTDETLSMKQRSNVLMDLRKAAIHPLLFRRHYTDDSLDKLARLFMQTSPGDDVREDFVREDLAIMTDFELHRFCKKHKNMAKYRLDDDAYMDSGKVLQLVKLLKRHIENGDRTLVFSQFTMVMDILEEVFLIERIEFSRLDGATKMAERQDLIDQYTQDASIPVFMLSTKAGGAGINLACANRVIIFDSSFNPQDDIQAENRAHRVGQTREVEVIRLVTKDTIEEQIMALGQTKLALDSRIAADVSQDEKENQTVELEGMELVEKMLKSTVRTKVSDPENGPKPDLKDEFMRGLKGAGLKISDG